LSDPFTRRRRHSPHDAEDIVQGFLANLLERGDLADLDRSEGRFRAFLRSACEHYLANRRDHDRAAKRGDDPAWNDTGPFMSGPHAAAGAGRTPRPGREAGQTLRSRSPCFSRGPRYPKIKRSSNSRYFWLEANDRGTGCRLDKEPIGQLVLRRAHLRLIVFDPEKGVIVQWIPE